MSTIKKIRYWFENSKFIDYIEKNFFLISLPIIIVFIPIIARDVNQSYYDGFEEELYQSCYNNDECKNRVTEALKVCWDSYTGRGSTGFLLDRPGLMRCVSKYIGEEKTLNNNPLD